MSPKKVALFAPEGFYAREVLMGAVRYSQEQGHWEIHFVDIRQPERFDIVRAMDGVLSYLKDEWVFDLAAKQSIPLVYTDDMKDMPGVLTTIADNCLAGQLAAEHFLERGFRHFAFIANWCHYSRLRLEGFEGQLRTRGFTCEVLRHAEESTDYWAIDMEKTAQWLQKLPKPLAVLACHDVYGMHMVSLCQSVGLRVPEEVAVVGVDNDEAFCQLCTPALSSVAMPNQGIGYEGAVRLDRIMAGGDGGPRVQTVAPRGVVIRQSSDAVGVDDPIVRQAMHFIHSHASESITVADVVRHVPACRSIVERKFRQVLGHSPSREIWIARIDLAKRRLMQSSLKIDDVARQCGFAGYQTFYTVFRRHTGQSPAEYRARAKVN